MKKSKFFYDPRTVIRGVSVINLILIPLICLIMGMRITLSDIIYGILISVSIIIMMPDTYKDEKVSKWFAIVTMLLTVVMTIMDCLVSRFLDSDLAGYIVYPLLCSIPLAVLFTLRSFRMMSDIQYLTMKTSGWEIMLCVVKQSYLMFLMSILSIVSSLSGALPDSAIWPRVILLLIALILFSILIVRSITASPIISYTEGGMPMAEKDVETCAFVPEQSKEDYKVMYNRLCSFLDNQKPYLNPDYNLDMLVRSMFSNKVYISRLINVTTGLNFNQLMNKYRVKFAKELYQGDTTLKVKDLADMSGFHSQVTFINAFKLFSGTTPGMWCKDYADKVKLLSNQEGQEQKLPLEPSVLDE